MYYIFSVLSGVLIAAMIAVNGGLTAQYGAWTATVMIHIVGLIFISIILIAKKEKLSKRGGFQNRLFLLGCVWYSKLYGISKISISYTKQYPI